MTVAPPALRLALDALLLWLGFFAGWSLVSIPLTLTCQPVGWLWLALAGGLVTAFLAYAWLRKPIGFALLDPSPLPWPTGPFPVRDLLLAGGGLAILAGAGLAFIVTSNALPLWGATLLLAVFTLVRTQGHAAAPQSRPVEPAAPGAAWTGLACLALLIAALYLMILRPDPDDAFYLNLPIGLLSGQNCMMAADTMLGTDGWPLLGSNYRVEALPTLTAALSWATGLPVITVGHLVLPLLWCLAWAAALAVIGHGLFGRHWALFAMLTVLAAMVLSGTLQTWGVHGIGRMFHGKAPLILIVFPLMIALVARGGANLPTFLALFGLSAVAVGLTANAIYLAPLVLGLSVVAAVVVRPTEWQRWLVLLAAAAPAVGAGLWLLLFDRPEGASDGGATDLVQLSLWEMASEKTTLGLLIGTLALAALAGRIGAGGRWLTAYLAAFLVLVLNPLLWPVYERFVTGGLNYRLWWTLPLPGFLAFALTYAVLRSGWPRAGGTLIAAGLAGLTLMPTGLIGMTETTLGLSAHKIPPEASAVARGVLSKAPDTGTVLAPERISAWLPVWEGHPDLVYARTLYLGHSATRVAPERLAPRQLLADWVAGKKGIPTDKVLAALRLLDVRVIVLPDGEGPADAEAVLKALQATSAPLTPGHVLWSVPAAAD
jgi:hypothetical protein